MIAGRLETAFLTTDEQRPLRQFDAPGACDGARFTVDFHLRDQVDLPAIALQPATPQRHRGSLFFRHVQVPKKFTQSTR